MVSQLTPTNFAMLTDLSPAAFNEFLAGTLPGVLGIETTDVAADRISTRTPIRPALLAPHGLVHGGTLVAIADTTCGIGTVVNLDAEASGFLTLELKSNFLGAVRSGVLLCVATPVHTGRYTHVWDAVVTHEQTGRRLAMFRCTQMVLHD